MSEFCFNLTTKKVSKTVAKKLDAICKNEGGLGFVGPVNIPGNHIKGWFIGPNLGHPFDSSLVKRVKDRIKEEGLSYESH